MVVPVYIKESLLWLNHTQCQHSWNTLLT